MLFKKKKKELPFGWSGDYSSWDEACQISKGYNQGSILDKVKESLLKVKNGEAVYERDSVVFDKIEYSWPLLAILLKISIEDNNKLNLIDFGGSLGSTYFQNRGFLSGLKELKWNVVEQAHFVEEGRKSFETGELKFFENLELAVEKTHSDIFLASSVIQYINSPYELMNDIKRIGFRYLIFDRTAFIDSSRDILTVQRVPPIIYEASYPSWFFNQDKFVNFWADEYILISDFDNGFTAPSIVNGMNAYWRGFIFEKK